MKKNKQVCSFFLIVELGKLNGSLLNKDESQTVKLKGGRTVNWPWKVQCGHRHKMIMLCYDTNVVGRVNAFKRREYCDAS